MGTAQLGPQFRDSLDYSQVQLALFLSGAWGSLLVVCGIQFFAIK